MQTILSELVRQNRLIVVDSLAMEEPKTAQLKSRLAEMDFDSGLLVTTELDENLYLASRNLPKVHSLDVKGLDPVSLVSSDKVVMTVDAVNKLQEWLG